MNTTKKRVRIENSVVTDNVIGNVTRFISKELKGVDPSVLETEVEQALDTLATNTSNVTTLQQQHADTSAVLNKLDYDGNIALIADEASIVTVNVRIRNIKVHNVTNYHTMITKDYADSALLYDYVKNQGYMFATVDSGLQVSDRQLFSVGIPYENITGLDNTVYFTIFLTHYSNGLPFFTNDVDVDVTLSLYKPNLTTNPNAYYSLRHMIEHPRLATTARATPAQGDVYVNNTGELVYYTGTVWKTLSGV